MSLVETIARALHATTTTKKGVWPNRPWETLGLAGKRHWIIKACAAILAMREPTEAMLIAGNKRRDHISSLPGRRKAMIDAALAEDCEPQQSATLNNSPKVTS